MEWTPPPPPPSSLVFIPYDRQHLNWVRTAFIILYNGVKPRPAPFLVRSVHLPPDNTRGSCGSQAMKDLVEYGTVRGWWRSWWVSKENACAHFTFAGKSSGRPSKWLMSDDIFVQPNAKALESEGHTKTRGGGGGGGGGGGRTGGKQQPEPGLTRWITRWFQRMWGVRVALLLLPGHRRRRRHRSVPWSFLGSGICYAHTSEFR